MAQAQETVTWQTLSEGPMRGTSIGQASLFEKTELGVVANRGVLYRTTVYKADGTAVSVSLAFK